MAPFLEPYGPLVGPGPPPGAIQSDRIRKQEKLESRVMDCHLQVVPIGLLKATEVLVEMGGAASKPIQKGGGEAKPPTFLGGFVADPACLEPPNRCFLAPAGTLVANL